MEVGEDQWFIVTDKLDQQGLSPELCRKRWESIKNMADLEAEKKSSSGSSSPELEVNQKIEILDDIGNDSFDQDLKNLSL